MNNTSIDQAPKNSFLPTDKQLNIGFVSIWFERGQSYVTKTIRDALDKEHNTFIFARTGGVYGEKKLETEGYWNVPNLTTFYEYEIPRHVIRKWIIDNRLDVIIFNEEYDWDLVEYCKETNIKVLTYLDYYEEDWRHRLNIYDAVLCSTKRTYHLVKNICNAKYIGWTVDTDLFKPASNNENRYTFFHNAGWLGINYRKMTPVTIAAFDIISKLMPEVSLFVHAQASLDKLPPEVIQIIEKNPQITYHVNTVPAPGLYHKGKILLFPSKLEGLGIPLLEGMACGQPAIAADAPPMNEFVQEGNNGLLVPVSRTLTRDDSLAFPENIVEIKDLAAKMAESAQHSEQMTQMGERARQYILKNMDEDTFRLRLLDALASVFKRKFFHGI